MRKTSERRRPIEDPATLSTTMVSKRTCGAPQNIPKPPTRRNHDFTKSGGNSALARVRSALPLRRQQTVAGFNSVRLNSGDGEFTGIALRRGTSLIQQWRASHQRKAIVNKDKAMVKQAQTSSKTENKGNRRRKWLQYLFSKPKTCSGDDTKKHTKATRKKTKKLTSNREEEEESSQESFTIEVENEQSVDTDSLTNPASFDSDYLHFQVPEEVALRVGDHEDATAVWDQIVDAVIQMENYEARSLRDPDFKRKGRQDFRVARKSLRNCSKKLQMAEEDLKMEVVRDLERKRRLYTSFDREETFDDFDGDWMGINASFDNNLESYVQAFEQLLSRFQCGPKQYSEVQYVCAA